MTITADDFIRPGWSNAAGHAAESLVVRAEGGGSYVTSALYARETLGRGLRYHRDVNWPTEATTLDVEGLPLAFHGSHGSHSEEALLDDGDVFARLALEGGSFFAQIGGHDRPALAAMVEQLREHFPRFELDEEDPRIAVTFWSLAEMGPKSTTRLIDVPGWDEIRDHYPAMATEPLDALMADDFEPGTGGQLILWHGPPGTGKTYALRALGWEWREWCDLHYIADPERFFGDRAAYMMDVLLAGDDGLAEVAPSGGKEPRPPHRLAKDGRWRLLVLEDTGELMSADARARSGQGLGRLLNTVDGLIGQGLRLLVLVTTNEEIRRLHDAVARPGRCAANVSFPALPLAEAREWLEKRGGDRDALPQANALTIAELFAALDGRNGKPAAADPTAAVGFGSS